MARSKSILAAAAFGALSIVLAAAPAHAQFFGSGDPPAQPATSSQPGPLSTMAQGLNPMNWKMPKLKMPNFRAILPTKQEKDMVVKKKNSFVDGVATTAKRSWTRTKETLNPMRILPAGFRSGGQTTPATTASQRTPTQKKPGFFQSLFSAPEPEPVAPNSVSGFLSQEPVR